MSRIISEKHQQEIVDLSVDHYDALIAYGGDMYHSGIVKGAVMSVVVTLGLTLVSHGVKVLIKHHKENNNSEEES